MKFKKMGLMNSNIRKQFKEVQNEDVSKANEKKGGNIKRGEQKRANDGEIIERVFDSNEPANAPVSCRDKDNRGLEVRFTGEKDLEKRNWKRKSSDDKVLQETFYNKSLMEENFKIEKNGNKKIEINKKEYDRKMSDEKHKMEKIANRNLLGRREIESRFLEETSKNEKILSRVAFDGKEPNTKYYDQRFKNNKIVSDLAQNERLLSTRMTERVFDARTAQRRDQNSRIYDERNFYDKISPRKFSGEKSPNIRLSERRDFKIVSTDKSTPNYENKINNDNRMDTRCKEFDERYNEKTKFHGSYSITGEKELYDTKDQRNMQSRNRPLVNKNDSKNEKSGGIYEYTDRFYVQKRSPINEERYNKQYIRETKAPNIDTRLHGLSNSEKNGLYNKRMQDENIKRGPLFIPTRPINVKSREEEFAKMPAYDANATKKYQQQGNIKEEVKSKMLERSKIYKDLAEKREEAAMLDAAAGLIMLSKTFKK